MRFSISCLMSVVLVATHLMSSSSYATRSIAIKDYLETGKEHETPQTVQHFHDLHRALAYLGKELDFAQEPKQLMGQILRVSEKKWSNKFEPYWRVFQVLAEETTRDKWPNWFITDLKHIVGHLDDLVFAPFRGLLEHYVPLRLLRWAKEFEHSHSVDEPFTRAYIPLVVAFKGAANLQEDEKLLKYLQRIELPSSAMKAQINLKTMAKAISKLVPKSGSKTQQIGDFLDKKCGQLRSDSRFSLGLDMLVLVNAFGGKLPLLQSTQIIIEFNRICSAWTQPDVREATLRALKSGGYRKLRD